MRYLHFNRNGTCKGLASDYNLETYISTIF